MLYEEIRSQLQRYLAGEVALEAFQAAFVPGVWEVYRSHDLAAAALAAEIELRLAEWSNAHWTEEELREQLRHTLREFVASGTGRLEQPVEASTPVGTVTESETRFPRLATAGNLI